MGVAERRAREKTQLRQEILDAAREIFATEGYQALTMRRVAERSRTCRRRLTSTSRTKPSSSRPSAMSSLPASCAAFRTWDAVTPIRSSIWRPGYAPTSTSGSSTPITTSSLSSPAPAASTTSSRTPPDSRPSSSLRRTVDACVAQGAIRTVDVDATAQSLWVAVHGLVALLISDKSFPFVGRQRLVDQLIDTLMRGLKP